jgi:hypothetical protein
MTDQPEVQRAREQILHEICLPCVHRNRTEPSGIAGSDVKLASHDPCEFEDTDKYCILAHKAADAILRTPDLCVKADDQTWPDVGDIGELTPDEEAVWNHYVAGWSNGQNRAQAVGFVKVVK